jgi:serine/threonine-protein kinase
MIGQTLQVRYRIVGELEDHPVWTCMRAEDNSGGGEVRIRLLRPGFASEPAFVAAIVQHADFLAQARPEGCELVRAFVQEGESKFLVTERPEAITLDERLRKLGALSVQLALTIAADACDGLASLHEHGLSHGDVSPYNVLVQPQGPSLLALPGFWETYSSSREAGLAVVSRMAPYLAPEVAAGSMPSTASDIYSLGVVLYQMVSGRVPYAGATAGAMAEKHATAAYPSLKLSLPSLPNAVDDIVRKCLSKAPFDRYANARALADDLRHVLAAMRFGHQLEWPRPAREPEVAPIAPTMNAIDQQPKSRAERIQKARASSRQRDGAPVWLSVLFYLTTALTLLAVGSWVAFNVRTPKLVDLPNVIGLPSVEAKKRLSDLGLKMVVLRRALSDRYAADVVIDQQPPAGKGKIRERSFVQVTLSKGGKTVVVPDLAGKTVDEAREILRGVGLRLDENLARARSGSIAKGLVAGHEPKAKSKVARDSSVSVTVSSGDQDPGGQGTRFTYSLTVKMPAGTVPVMVRVEMTDAEETKVIHEEEHLPDESFDLSADGVGEQATFRIYFDDNLVRQVTKKAE